jgi:hypothetical protein
MDPHFRLEDNSGGNNPHTNTNSTFIETPQGYGYFFAQISKQSTRFLEYYDEILSAVTADTLVFSFYGVYHYDVVLFYLAAFLPQNYNEIIFGYRVKTTTNKVSVESTFSQYKNAHNRTVLGSLHGKKKLVFLTNHLLSPFLGKLFPESVIYSPNPELRTQMHIGFEGVTYYAYEEIPEDEIPANIIFDMPPKKYWPC